MLDAMPIYGNIKVNKMQQCSCSTGFRFPDNQGVWMCSVCGTEWPDDPKPVKPEVLRKAKELFHDHENSTCTNDHYWDKCHPDLQKAWIVIAEDDLGE